MTKRKGLSKSVRFEVFKRDAFTCQYCGGKAPDVILHVDHINPVASGGENDILNLITACEPCNLGKGARKLTDKGAIDKQRAQLEELNERREQLEMMLQWREALSSLDDEYVDAVDSAFEQHTGCTLSEFGRTKTKEWLKKHGLTEVLDSLDAAMSTYYKEGDTDRDKNNQMAGEAFRMVPRIIASRKQNADKPWMKDLFYIRAILRNRLGYCNEKVALTLLQQAFQLGIHVEEMKDWAKQARNWTVWRREMEEWIDTYSTGDDQ